MAGSPQYRPPSPPPALMQELELGVGASVTDAGLRAVAVACVHLLSLKLTLATVSGRGEDRRWTLSGPGEDRRWTLKWPW